MLPTATSLAESIAAGPTFAHGMTKKCLHEEWHLSLDEAISAEARVQAICMDTEDFARGYRAFVEKRPPVFEGR